MGFIFSGKTWAGIATGLAAAVTTVATGGAAAPLWGALAGGAVGGLLSGIANKSVKSGLEAFGVDSVTGLAFSWVGGLAGGAVESMIPRIASGVGQYALSAGESLLTRGAVQGAAEGLVDSLLPGKGKNTATATAASTPITSLPTVNIGNGTDANTINDTSPYVITGKSEVAV